MNRTFLARGIVMNQCRRKSTACPLGIGGVIALILSACARGPVPVSIHGVNYSNEPFSYIVEDPFNAQNTGGGELIDRYAAGGTMCCYELPRNWTPGMKVSIKSTYWEGKRADRSRETVTTVDIPAYPDGKPGELWILRMQDGHPELVVSDLQPDHASWPGKTKGWPIPSIEYQRERWDIYIEHQMSFVRTFEALQKEMDESPDKAALDEWDTSLEYDKKSLAGYSGPKDPAFRAKLKRENAEGLAQTKAEVLRLQKGRP